METDLRLYYPGLFAYCEWANAKAQNPVPRFSFTSGIVAMSGCISATRQTPFGDGLSAYYILVAGSGVGKRAPTECACEAIRAISSRLVADRDPISANGLLTRLAQQPAITYFFQEFGSWFEGIASSQSVSQKQIATSFLKLWDCPKILEGYDNKREIDSMAAIENPVVSILGNLTPDAFQRITQLKSVKHDGLGGRFEPIIVSENDENEIEQRPLRLITEKDRLAIPEIVLNCLEYNAKYTLEDIEKARRVPDENNQSEWNNIKYRERIPFEITEAARELIETIRKGVTEEKHSFSGISEHIIARKTARIIRTACILCAWRNSNIVDDIDVSFSFSFHNGNFNKSAHAYNLSEKEDRNAIVESIILSYIREKKKIKWSEVYKIKGLKGESAATLLRAKASLISSEMITCYNETTQGRPVEWVREVT